MQNRKHRFLGKKGTTLLEVLIALVLFTAMAVSLMRMTDKTIKYRKKIMRNVKDMKFSRNIFQVIRKDIRNSFYIMDMNSFFHQPLLQQTQRRGADPSPRPQNRGRQASLALKLSAFEQGEIEPYLYRALHYSGGFIGTQNSLRMASFSHIPDRENGKTGDRNIVFYYLKDCKSRESRKTKSLCLWRRFSSFMNQNIEELKDYDEFALLERVKKFQLSYYSISTNEWMKEWKTGAQDKNILPSAVHIIIEFENKKKQLVKNEIKIPVHQQFILPVQQ